MPGCSAYLDYLATFDGRPWRGVVDCIIAGLPCQPYSLAGKRIGNDDARSWGDGAGPIPSTIRIIDEARPALVWLENVPAWVVGGFFQPVAEALSAMGYRVESPIFVAAEDVGASHRRERVFVMAHSGSFGRRPKGDSDGTSRRIDNCSPRIFAPGPDLPEWLRIIEQHPHLAPAIEPGVFGVVDGNSLVVDQSRANQIRAIGNGAVPLCFAVAVAEFLRRIDAVTA